MARSSSLARVGMLTLMLGASSWVLCFPSAFIGAGAPSSSDLTQMYGYRLDNMLEGKNGDRSLDTSEGYWIGEKGWIKACNAQGYRYRMRALPDELKQGIDTPKLFELGPLKLRLGEMFGGTGNNDKLRELKRKLFNEPLDPKKVEENEYWVKRYGHKRWYPKNINQSGAKGNNNLLRGLAAWSGYDPLNEERGKTWFEADYGKPWIAAKGDVRLPGFVTKEQLDKEFASGRLNPPKEESK
eukprot:TRINITY_DN525_c0_g1_i2.p1 TRINITY_DN525_c0_g1~~TRINITY_DN525_c0_g1_i2.p1  ORF type:complete len:241 (+),score=69.58 TRINITY_DN525_c0_g1_i2:97-819(+)